MFRGSLRRLLPVVLSLLVCFLGVRYSLFTSIHARREKQLISRVTTSYEYSSSPSQAHYRSRTPSGMQCDHVSSVVFAKTHKTGGSTLGSIVARYGYERNLSIALPRPNKTIFGTREFQSSMLFSKRSTADHNLGFHILFNHVPFNKTAISEVMRSEVKFITILRDPVKQFYSAVQYFKLQEQLLADGNLSSSSFDLRNLLGKIKHCQTYRCSCTYNGQSVDLGVFQRSGSAVRTQAAISEKVDKDFDLVLILEYFDESLILLRKLLCWEFMDILYISKKESNQTFLPPKKHRRMIRVWNYADTALYKHFNRTLWKKIEEYGPTFGEELNYFRLLRKIITGKCKSPFIDESDEAFKPIPITAKEFCDNLIRDVKPYTELFQHVQ